jgi:hypothetical protein
MLIGLFDILIMDIYCILIDFHINLPLITNYVIDKGERELPLDFFFSYKINQSILHMSKCTNQ